MTDSKGSVNRATPRPRPGVVTILPPIAWVVTARGAQSTVQLQPEAVLGCRSFASVGVAACPAQRPGRSGVIDLSRPHYGIHGTPEPGSVGYTTSHGCVRLTNWDAMRLRRHGAPGDQGRVRPDARRVDQRSMRPVLAPNCSISAPAGAPCASSRFAVGCFLGRYDVPLPFSRPCAPPTSSAGGLLRSCALPLLMPLPQ